MFVYKKRIKILLFPNALPEVDEVFEMCIRVTGHTLTHLKNIITSGWKKHFTL